MKRVLLAVVGALAVCLSSASTDSQQSRTAHDQHMVHVTGLYSVFQPFGYPDHPADLNRPKYPGGLYAPASMTRVDVAVFTNWALRMSQVMFLNSDIFESNVLSKGEPYIKVIAENYWHLEFLMREFRAELIGIVVDYERAWNDLKSFKTTLAERGIELRDPYNERFTDVPEGHWADAAIHNLRRAGIVYGYPDGTFRM